MKIIIIVQARMSSTRLPGKVMLNLGSKKVIDHVFDQLSYCKKAHNVILATSTDPSDDILAEWAKKRGVCCYRGDLDDVLDRYYKAAKQFEANAIVRVTADCPLIDPEIVDLVICGFLKGDKDYVSNIHPPTFPNGQDVEIFSFCMLEKVWREAKLASEREHVTPYFYKHPEIFKLGNVAYKEDRSKIRWTLDYEEDYKFIGYILKNISQTSGYAKLEDMLSFMDNIEDVDIVNKNHKRNEGYEKSLRDDKTIK